MLGVHVVFGDNYCHECADLVKEVYQFLADAV